MFEYSLKQTGQMHMFQNRACEDHTARHSKGSVRAISLGDGVSACRYGGETAQAVTKAAASALAERFDELWHMSEDALREEMVEVIRNAQDRLAAQLWSEGGVWRSDMGCTLMAAAIDSKNGRHIALSLGDGIVLARRCGEEQAQPLLMPVRVNMGGKALPVVTVYEAISLKEFLQIDRGERVYDTFFMASDGFENSLFSADGQVSPTVEQLCSALVQCPHRVRGSFPTAVESLGCADDASLSVLINRPPQASTFDEYGMALRLFGSSRRTRRLCDFARYLDKGFSPYAAANRSGLRWRKRDIKKAFGRLQAVGFM